MDALLRLIFFPSLV